MTRLLLQLILLASLVIFLKGLAANYYPDFTSYYYAPVAVANGRNPYLGGPNFFTPFVYPPPVIRLFQPWTLLPFNLAQKLFAVFSAGCFFLALGLILKISRVRAQSNQGLIWLILALNFFPAKFTLGMGQINHLILLLLTLFIYFYQTRRDGLAGLALAATLTLKLFPPLLLVWLAWRRRGKILLACLAGLIFFWLKPPWLAYWWTTVLPSLADFNRADYYNQALSGLLSRSGWSGLYLPVALGLILSAGPNWMSWLTLSVIINPFAWQHHLVWLLLPLGLTWQHLPRRWRWLWWLSYLLLAVNLKQPELWPVLVRSHAVFGALLLLLVSRLGLEPRTKSLRGICSTS